MSDSLSIANTIDILGPQIQFLTPLVSDPDEYCVISAVVPPNVVVPLHSHPERETFLILSGALDAFDGLAWRTYRAGEVFDVPGGVKHAFRNTSAEPVSMVLVTKTSMGHFFRSGGCRGHRGIHNGRNPARLLAREPGGECRDRDLVVI
jgi:quercetin dioxygenase-like cupin family protein